MIITYDPNSNENIVNDNQAMELMFGLIEKGEDFTVCQDMAILCTRIAVKRGLIDPDDLTYRFVDENSEEHILIINKDARIDEWPKGFCDHTIIYTSEILTRG